MPRYVNTKILYALALDVVGFIRNEVKEGGILDVVEYLILGTLIDVWEVDPYDVFRGRRLDCWIEAL